MILETGNHAVGGPQHSGVARNVCAHNLSGVAGVLFALESDYSSEQHPVIVLDGEIAEILPTGVRQTALPVAAGRHDLRIETYREGEVLPDYHGDYEDARRVFIRWPHGDSTTALYKVYYDNRTGTADQLYATVSGVAISKMRMAGPATGTGTGRVSIYGNYIGTTVNDTLTVTITGDGAASWAFNGDSGTLAFFAGAVISLPYGILVEFHDPESRYAADDTYTAFIGVANWLLTSELTEGRYLFTVSAVDAAGNASTVLTAKSFHVIHGPNSVSSASITYDSDTSEIVLGWRPPADSDLAAVDIFTNLDKAFGLPGQYVLEDNAYAQLAASATSYRIAADSLPDGEYMFYIRTRDADGRSDRSIQMLRMSLPYVPPGLSAPAKVTATQLAGGLIRVAWSYHSQRQDPVAGFRIYAKADDDTDIRTAYDLLATATYTATKVKTQAFTADMSTNSLASGTTVYFLVVAVDAAGNETQNAETVSAVTDKVAPVLSGAIQGTVQ